MIAQSVADILGDHVKLTVEGIDRMYLNVYVPRLQTEQGVVWFFREHRGQPLSSAALMSPMSRGFVAKLEGFVAEHEIPLVQFRKGQHKDTVMAEHLPCPAAIQKRSPKAQSPTNCAACVSMA